MVFSTVVAGVFNDFKQELLRLYNDFTGTEQHSSSSSDMIASSMTLPDQTPPETCGTLPDQTPPEPCGPNDESKSVITAEKVEQSNPQPQQKATRKMKKQMKAERAKKDRNLNIRALGKWKVYTDGSFSPYQKNGGYGVYFGNDDPRNMSRYLDYCRNSFDAEVDAISAGLNAIYTEIKKIRKKGRGEIHKYVLVSDSKDAISAIINYIPRPYYLTWRGSSYDYMRQVNEKYHAIRAFYLNQSEVFSGHVFDIYWVRGHSGVEGNNKADKLAKLGRLSYSDH